MKVFLSRGPQQAVVVMARAEGSGVLGDLFREVKPGQSLLGYSHQELAALGSGEKDLPPKPQSLLSRLRRPASPQVEDFFHLRNCRG